MSKFLAALVGCLLLACTISAAFHIYSQGDKAASLGWVIISMLVAVGTGVCHWYPKELDGG